MGGGCGKPAAGSERRRIPRFADRRGVGRAWSARSDRACFSALGAEALTAPASFRRPAAPRSPKTLISGTTPQQEGGSGKGGSRQTSPARRGGRAAILKSLHGSSSSAPSVRLRAALPLGALTGRRVLGLAGSGNALGAVTGPTVAPLSTPPVISSLGSRQRGESSGSPAVCPDGVREKVLAPSWGSLRAPPSLRP